MEDCFIEFWRKMDFSSAPYKHPSDCINGKYIESKSVNNDTFLRNQNIISRNKFHLNLIPQPYMGDIKNAEIFILMKNPGLSIGDYYAEESCPAFRSALIDTVYQRSENHVFLDTRWMWTSGFMWWEKKLRSVTKIVAKEKFSCDYKKSLNYLSKCVASIELYPYHSFETPSLRRLYSKEMAIRFVKSLPSDKIIIVPRSVSEWNLPDSENIIKYSTSHARSASLSDLTVGGKEILKKLKICR